MSLPELASGDDTIRVGRSGNVSLLAGSALAIAAAAAVAPLAAAEGGYFSTSWAWAALPMAWIAAMALFLRTTIDIHRVEVAFAGAFALLTSWMALSLLWTRDFQQTMLETERTLVYVAAVLAVLLVARADLVHWIVAGMAAACFCICAYALATRLFPTSARGGTVAGNRLEGTLGYSNGLGVFAAISILLAVGVLARNRWIPGRALAGAAIVVMSPTLYFTYSRGGWVALTCGALLALAIDPRRLYVSLRMLTVAPFVAGGLLVGARSPALTQLDRSLHEATVDGHTAAVAIGLLALGAALAIWMLEWLGGRVEPGRRLRRVYALGLLTAALASAAFTIGHFGGPVSSALRVYRSFTGPALQVGSDKSLNGLLFSFSSNGRIELWRVAWDDFAAHPLLGSGAGSYEQLWYANRTVTQNVRDAHSLYLETMAELGLPGLLALATGLVAPLAVIGRARRHAFGPALFSVYIAYLLHAALDWDWELPAITLTALMCGCLLLVLARARQTTALRTRGRAAVALFLLVPLLGLSVYTRIGNGQLASAETAAGDGQWRRAAEEARTAMGWMPWASSPWHVLAAADAALGRRQQAAKDMRQAIKRSPLDWRLWYDLGNVSIGAERRNAYARARMLNPREVAIPRV